jgi:hypothetical protein
LFTIFILKIYFIFIYLLSHLSMFMVDFINSILSLNYIHKFYICIIMK